MQLEENLMNEKLPTPALHLEFVSGPLDGHRLCLRSSTEWGLEGDGLLSFPWHDELGSPQARFFPRTSPNQTVWCIEAFPAPHQTYLLRPGIGIPHLLSEIASLHAGDILMTSQIFLRVNRAA